MKATKILVYSFPRVDFCDIGVQVDRQIAGECIDLILVDEPPSAGKECVPEWAIRTKSRQLFGSEVSKIHYIWAVLGLSAHGSAVKQRT